MNIKPISAFQSNYLWLIEDSTSAAIIDPGDASPVLETLWSEDLELKYILITHHHPDHVGGIRELKKHFPNCIVYGPANEKIPLIDHKLKEDDQVELGPLGTYKILDIPGHTAGHIAYYDSKNAFVGDTVFVVGCGRLFEGTPAQMVNSFTKIKQLSFTVASTFTIGAEITKYPSLDSNIPCSANLSKNACVFVASLRPKTISMFASCADAFNPPAASKISPLNI